MDGDGWTMDGWDCFAFTSVMKNVSFGRSALQKNTRLLGDASRSGGSGSSNTLDGETQGDTRKRSTGDA